ncbi:DUF2062 domain-containing protein [Sphingorhabdus arenilitoris]|uniref:DUF2062 domain-containing protein n=1 Tax=Sphingorhabdus arenilitoris TaxID=1490041 RepID=A0ABV8RET0_9SPHN
MKKDKAKKTWLDRNLPTREGLAENKYLKPFSNRFLRSELWRFTRRSVPRGVALGLFSAFIVPVGQIFLAAFMALPLRANVPVAVLTTFITNPLTFPFWFYVANQIGGFVMRVEQLTGEPMVPAGGSGRWEWFAWLAQEAGLTAIGLVMLAIVSSAIGYFVSSWLWDARIRTKRARRRSKLLAARREKQL